MSVDPDILDLIHQDIDGVATPCIRSRGAGNATYGSFSAAC